MPSYTYDDFLSAANSSGLLGEFSQADLDTAMQHPEFGLSILSLKKDYHNATTDEQRMLVNEAANQLRSSYGNYMGGTDGSQYYSQGKIPGQIDTVLDQIHDYGSFDYGTTAPVYDNQYAQTQQALLDQILNREDFSWSQESDPQWSSYKKAYLREGDRATANALGQAAAASGGRPSTAAVTAATQAGDYYATQLSDVIPTLYQQAYDRYLNEYNMMLQDLGAVNTQEQLDYQRYLNDLNQYNTDRSFAYQQYLNDFSQLQNQLAALQGQDASDYDRYMDEINMDIYRDELAAQAAAESQALAQAQVDAMLAAGGTPSAELIAASGYSDEYVQALLAAWQRENGTYGGSGYSGGGGGGSGYNNGGLTTAQIREMQNYYGTTADGLWGANSTAAAGGRNATEAWAYYQSQTGGGSAGGWSDVLPSSTANGLGVGPVDYATLENLVEAGKADVYTGEDGNLQVKWSSGYNVTDDIPLSSAVRQAMAEGRVKLVADRNGNMTIQWVK